jgi:hypothetical protein
MRRSHLVLLGATLMAALQGCHCCNCSNVYYDSVDNVSDHIRSGPKLDGVYCEALDVTRYGMTRPTRRTDCPSAYPRHRAR